MRNATRENGIFCARSCNRRCRAEARRYIYICKDELRDEERVAQIGKRIIETLGGVDGADRVQIALLVFSKEHAPRLKS